MRKLSFTKLCPSGNPTILLNAQDVAPQERASASAALMQPLHLYAEQVGFVDMLACPPRLDMMGGEFCLNATRGLVYEMLRQKRFFPLQGIDDLFGLARCSGTDATLQVRVKLGKTRAANAPAECSVIMLEELRPDTLRQLEDGITLARVPGIAHLLVDEAKHPRPADHMQAAKEYMARYSLLKEPACGVIWHKVMPAPPTLTPPPGHFISCAITPVVHVAETNSLVLESACGSGTLALALSHSGHGGLVFMSVQQPGGDILRARMECPPFGSRRCKVEVGGWVRLVAEGETYLA